MKIVSPGDLIAEKPVQQAYTFIENSMTFATVSAIQNDDGRLVPLRGPYEPMMEDFIVGIVTEVKFAGYVVQLNAPYTGFLSSRDCETTFVLGDVIYGRILTVDEVRSTALTEARRLKGGRVIKFPAVKVPRLIGKKNSMINMVRTSTGCDIVVGRNGYVWLSNAGNTQLAISAINMIESEAHIPGLTDRVAAYLKEKTGKEVSMEAPASENPEAHGEEHGAPRRGTRREGLSGKEGEF